MVQSSSVISGYISLSPYIAFQMANRFFRSSSLLGVRRPRLKVFIGNKQPFPMAKQTSADDFAAFNNDDVRGTFEAK